MTNKFEIKIVLRDLGDKCDLEFVPGHIDENVEVTHSSIKFTAMCIVFENILNSQMRGNLELADIMSNMLMEVGNDNADLLFKEEGFH